MPSIIGTYFYNTKQYKLSRDTIKSTLYLDLEHKDGKSKPQLGQPKDYLDRDKRKIL